MDNVIDTQGLTKRYGNGVTAVDGATMTVRRAEVYGFLGPNGAGKTTTLRTLVGLIKPTSGTANIAGLRPEILEALMIRWLNTTIVSEHPVRYWQQATAASA